MSVLAWLACHDVGLLPCCCTKSSNSVGCALFVASQVIFLYLLDNETSMVVLASAGGWVEAQASLLACVQVAVQHRNLLLCCLKHNEQHSSAAQVAFKIMPASATCCAVPSP